MHVVRIKNRQSSIWALAACLLLSISSISLLGGAHAYAEEGLGIAAVVNDEVISTLDLNARIKLALATSGKQDTPHNRERAQKQVMQMLIDEALKIQEANRFSILIDQGDIDDAIYRIEQLRKRPPGSLMAFIDANGLSKDSFHRQIRGEVAWSKLISRKIRRNVTLSDEEVYRAQQRLASGTKVSEVQIASIILPFTDTLTHEETLGIARDIRSQLRAGAEGPELVKQYADRIPVAFGPMTWVARKELHPDITQAIESLKVGEIAEPVRSPQGYQLIRLLDERVSSTVPDQDAEVAVKQIVIKLDEKSLKKEIDAYMDIAREIAKYPGSCVEQGVAGMKDFSGLNFEVNFVRTTLAAMSRDVRMLVEPLKLTGITEPFAAPDGIHLLMLCEKISLPAKLPDRDKVREALFQEKLELEVEKYLRTLRREAFIDIRV